MHFPINRKNKKNNTCMETFMIKRKGYDQVCHIQKKSYKEDEIVYITFPGLEKTGCVKHLFSTIIGGVSRGMF